MCCQTKGTEVDISHLSLYSCVQLILNLADFIRFTRPTVFLDYFDFLCSRSYPVLQNPDNICVKPWPGMPQSWGHKVTTLLVFLLGATVAWFCRCIIIVNRTLLRRYGLMIYCFLEYLTNLP